MENAGKGWQSFFTFYTCKTQVDEMNSCLKHYYQDQEFRYYIVKSFLNRLLISSKYQYERNIILFHLREECTQMYLEKRSQFRRTGIIEKDPYYKVNVQYQ